MQTNVKQQVREFYDQVGWQKVSEGVYQNAHYEDLRPVSQEYIHRCHLRILRHIRPTGRFLLDAGSGPIQYPEYLEYSRGYQYRVCADISMVALQEARERIGEHGLFVVCDIANLPFKADAFDSAVSLHTIHHLPEEQHEQAYGEMHRVLSASGLAAIVNGWPSSRFMRFFEPGIRLSNRIQNLWRKEKGAQKPAQKRKNRKNGAQKGTFTERHDVTWINQTLRRSMPLEIHVWRSASVRFMRALIHPRLGGRWWLKLLFWLEERSPRFFAENGQYPIIVIQKSGNIEKNNGAKYELE